MKECEKILKNLEQVSSWLDGKITSFPPTPENFKALAEIVLAI